MKNTQSKAVSALVGGSGVLAAFFPSAAVAQEAQLPAVSNLNAKLTFGAATSGGSTGTKGAFGNGAVSFPVSSRLGGQLDFGGTEGSRGLGLHLFMRDPAQYLVGIYAHTLNYDVTGGTARNVRYGVEAEGYFGDLTVAGFLGRDEVSGDVTDATFNALEMSLDYYLTGDTMLSLTGDRAFGKQSASVGITHLYNAGSTPFAASGSVGLFDGDATASIGVTVFFGSGGKTLKEIHRQNDPRVRLGVSSTRSGYFGALTTNSKPAPCSKFCG